MTDTQERLVDPAISVDDFVAEARVWFDEHAVRRPTGEAERGWGEGEFDVSVFSDMSFEDERDHILRIATWIQTKATPDGGVSVAFKNDGPPIRDGVIGKIFDPFFTTKDAGKGTGLGLSIAHGIITDHGGSIAAENLADGVRFSIQFPHPDTSLSPSSFVLKKEAEVVRGKDILVVEDEEVIRDLLKRLLLKDGHRVTAVSNGEEAVKFIQERSCDLVISDLKMPGMDGISLYHRLSEIRHQLKNRFLLITGTIQNEVNQFSESTGNLYLQKPFKQAELRRAFSSIFGK